MGNQHTNSDYNDYRIDTKKKNSINNNRTYTKKNESSNDWKKELTKKGKTIYSNDEKILVYINDEPFEATPIRQCDREGNKNNDVGECLCYQVDLQQQCGKYIQSIVDEFISFDVHLTDSKFCGPPKKPSLVKHFTFDTHCLARGKDYVRMYPSLSYWEQLEKMVDSYPGTFEFELVIYHRQMEKKKGVEEVHQSPYTKDEKKAFNDKNKMQDVPPSSTAKMPSNKNDVPPSSTKKNNNDTRPKERDFDSDELKSSNQNTRQKIKANENNMDIDESEVDRIFFRVGPKTRHIDIPMGKLHLDELFQTMLEQNQFAMSVFRQEGMIHNIHSWKMEDLMLFICEDQKQEEEVEQVCLLNPFR